MSKGFVLLIALLLLVACGGSASDTESNNTALINPNDSAVSLLNTSETDDVVSNNEDSTSVNDETTMLNEDYPEAIPMQTQLIVGTLLLEETDLAVDTTLAADLLPLWQAVQSLNNSDATAEAEVTAVVNQIQNTMTAEQIEAIVVMQLTTEDIQTATQNLNIDFRALLEEQGGLSGDGGFGGAIPGGGGPGGGGPGGGGPGGGGPGGGGPGGGGPGGGGQQLSSDERATRAAELGVEGGFSGGGGRANSRFLIIPLISLLQAKVDGTELPSVE